MNERNVAAIHASLNGMSLVHAAREPGTTDEDLREAIAALLAADGVFHPQALTDEQCHAFAGCACVSGYPADCRETLAKIARGEP